MGGGLFGGGSKPTVTKAPEPTVAATPPPPEETAEALPQASAGRDGIGTAFDAPPGEKAGYRNRGTE